MKNTYKLILFLLLITHASFGQDVKGYIKVAESKEALAGGNVFYKDKGGTRGTVSDINGYYELKVTDGDPVFQSTQPHGVRPKERSGRVLDT